ncbi:hypothetical protein [Nocardiopsis sp. CC223A]|uniref:hypothetical protein n=1 Tax=Nocardiopsis sp. CC223A TaxID=3044051 RepID=UPI00278C1032|nr:hypothetical protein [Nocardiopsis sp. CC223A]
MAHEVNDEAKKLRVALTRAGLLDVSGVPRRRPEQAAFERARTAAGSGTPLSDLASEERE